MKRSNKDESIVHYIPEFYNSNVNEKTGKEYGWCELASFKKPYTSKKMAMNWIDRYRQFPGHPKHRLRIETFKCVDVKFEEI